MPNYRLYGMKLISDLKIDRLLSEEAATAWEKSHNVLESGDITTITVEEHDYPQCINQKSKIVGEFNKSFSWLRTTTCMLTVSNGSSITYKIHPNASSDNLETFILGSGIAMLALQKDMLPMHASCISKGDEAILICGDSGAGKSTLTTSLLESGYLLMADDVTLISISNGRPVAYPAFPAQKLCRNVVEERRYDKEDLSYIDENKDKYLVKWHGDFSPCGKTITKMIYITMNDSISLDEKIDTGIDCFFSVSNNIFMKDLFAQFLRNEEWGKMILKLASKIQIMHFVRPKNIDTQQEIFHSSISFIESKKKEGS